MALWNSVFKASSFLEDEFNILKLKIPVVSRRSRSMLTLLHPVPQDTTGVNERPLTIVELLGILKEKNLNPDYVELCDDFDLVSDWFEHDVKLLQGLIMHPDEISRAPHLRK